MKVSNNLKMCLGKTKANLPCKRKDHPYCYQHLPYGDSVEKSKTIKSEPKEKNGRVELQNLMPKSNTPAEKGNKENLFAGDDEVDIGDNSVNPSKLSGTDTENDDTEEDSPESAYSEHSVHSKISKDTKGVVAVHSESHRCSALTLKKMQCKNMIKDKDQLLCRIHQSKVSIPKNEDVAVQTSKSWESHQCLGTTKEEIRCKVIIRNSDELYCHHHYTQDMDTKRMDVDKYKCNGIKPNGEQCQRNLKTKKYCHDHIHQDPSREPALIHKIGKANPNEIRKIIGECCECGSQIEFGFYCGAHFVEEIAWVNKYLKELELGRLLGMPATSLKKFAYRIYKGISVGDGLGFVYVYSDLSQSTINNEIGNFKVGRALDTDKRIGQWEKDCGNKYKNQFQLEFNHYKIAETLVHYELEGLGFRNDNKFCHSCQREHVEWFNCEIGDIKRVINEWNKYLSLYVDH